jgi:hypothetical protein
MLVGLLDHGTKRQPSLSLGKETIPILKGAQVESRCQEEADCVVDELVVRVRIVTKKCNFGLMLDSAEEYIRGIGSRVGAVEDPIILFKNGQGRVAIQLGQLIEDDQRGHPGMPSLDGQVIRYLQCNVDGCIQGGEACSLDVKQALVVVLGTCIHRIDCHLLRPHQGDSRIRNHPRVVGVDGMHVNSVCSQIGGAAEWG